ncbi:uncharacterized protein LOC119719645 [Patiria miniata]|uniref:Uncharacterized protein n=1 Tax=Patiria miniata TaxID=46514 RepID=A0A913YZS2_PATMI|nr:uncharacterized protein LOC119719645 [Patiria miniata]
MNPGDGQSPAQNSLPGGNTCALTTFGPDHQQGTLKPPGHFTPTSPHDNQEGPKTLSSIPGGPSPAGQSDTKRRSYSVDGSPISNSGDGQSTQQRSLPRSASLQNKQSSHVAAHPKVRASSYHGEEFAANISSPGSGFGSAEKESSVNLVQGSSVDRLMGNMTLQESHQLMEASKSPGCPDDDDIENHSHMQVGPISPSSKSGTGQDGGSPTPPWPVTPVMTGSQGSNPCGMSFSPQDLGSMTWPLKNRSEKKGCNNRRKVKKMEPMKELEAMNEAQRLDRIQEKQNDILEKTQTAEEGAEQQPMTNLDKITIHCKECSALVCKASELRRKGDAGPVTCTSPELNRWMEQVRYRTLQRNRNSDTVGVIKCGTFYCGNQLGTLQPQEGYDLNAQSVKVIDEMGGVTYPVEWEETGFQVVQG